MLFRTIWILLLPQFVPRSHTLERFLHVKSTNHNWAHFSMIVVQVKNGSDARLGLTRILGRPVHLVMVFNCCGQVGALVDEDVVPATMRVAFKEQRCLVDAVNDAVGRNVLRGARQSSESRK